jgi:hypothetical protein
MRFKISDRIEWTDDYGITRTGRIDLVMSTQYLVSDDNSSNDYIVSDRDRTAKLVPTKETYL